MIEHERKHFDGIAARYQDAADSWRMLHEQAARHLTPLVADRIVVDVGNGGRFAYDTAAPARLIAVDIAPKMLDPIVDPKIEKIVDDGRELSRFADGSIDVLVFGFVIHHIAGASVAETQATLDRLLATAHRKLARGGDLVILEGVLDPVLYALQCLLFPLTRFCLGRGGVSMLFFHRLPHLRRRAAAHFGVVPADVEVAELAVKGWIDPLGGTFPGWIRIPAFLQPMRYRLLRVRRGGGPLVERPA